MLYHFLILLSIVCSQNLFSAEIRPVPQLGTVKVLFALTNLEGRQFDEPFEYMTEENKIIMQKMLGQEKFEALVKSLTAGVDLSDPVKKIERYIPVLQKFISEASYGKLNIEYDILPVSVSIPYKTFDNLCWTAAEMMFPNIKNREFSEEEYDKIFFITPPLGCSNISGAVDKIGGKFGFIRSLYLGDRIPLGTITHEFGHALGAIHAQTMDCGTSIISDSCFEDPYGSLFDVMGNSKTGHLGDLSSVNKEKMGWLSADSEQTIQEISSNGIYHLTPLETSDPGVKGLKLKFDHPALDGMHWLYIDYRTVSRGPKIQGIVLNLVKVNELYPQLYSINQLDLTPQTKDERSFLDATLALGQTFSEGNVSIKLIDIQDGSADLQVSIK